MYDCPTSDWRNPDEFDHDPIIEHDADAAMDAQADAWNARMTGQDHEDLTMIERQVFPENCAGRMYLNLTDYEDQYGPEFGYLVPADYVDGGCVIGDCWIVDRSGDIHPDYSVRPVPFPASAIGEEME